MSSKKEIDRLLEPSSEPFGIKIGFDGAWTSFFNCSDSKLEVGRARIGDEDTRIGGNILVDGNDKVQSSLFGFPFRVHDNAFGLIPSTLFTPTPAFQIVPDKELVEYGMLASFIAEISAIGAIGG